MSMRGDPTWFPFVWLGLFIAFAGLGLAAGWALVGRRGPPARA